MAKYDVFVANCVSKLFHTNYYSVELIKYFVLKHGEDVDKAQLLIQRYLNKQNSDTLVISLIPLPLEGYNTSDIPEQLIAQMNGIYNLSNEVCGDFTKKSDRK